MLKRLPLTPKEYADICLLLQVAQMQLLTAIDECYDKAAIRVQLAQWASRAADLREKIEGHESSSRQR